MATKDSETLVKGEGVENSLEEKLKELERENQRLKQIIEKEEENTSIPLDAYIEVMSLIPWKLNLSTEALGRGRQFSFTKFGEVKRILYNDLASIFENYRSFMEQGLFYILDARVIRKHGLDDIYDNILSKEMIEQILSFNPKKAVKLYESTNPKQQEVINSMLIEKIKLNPDSIDFNVINQISKICGQDLAKLGAEARALEEMENK